MNYLERESDDFMLTDGLMKAWSSVHWNRCGWYLDCPLNKPPSFNIALRDSLEPTLVGIGTPWEKAQSPPADGPVEKATTKTKRVTKRKAPLANTTKASTTRDCDPPMEEPVVSVLPAPGAAEVTAEDPVPQTSVREPPPKRQGTDLPPQSQPALYLSPPQRWPVSTQPAPAIGGHTSLDLILNDSFVRLAEEKKKTGKFGPQYDDILAFLTKVSFSNIKVLCFPFLQRLILFLSDLLDFNFLTGGCFLGILF